MSRIILSTPAKHTQSYVYNEKEISEFTETARKRRRISIAGSLASTSSDVSKRSKSTREKENDRFIPQPTDSPLPLVITPRTKRFAKQIGTSKGCFLNFQDKQVQLHRHISISPTKKKTLSIMRHCTSSLNESTPSQPSASARFHLQGRADTVLDAPLLFDDYYSRPVDWSSSNHIACATARTLNIRDMDTLKVTILNTSLHVRGGESNDPRNARSITNIKYNPQKPEEIALGLVSGHTQIWDCIKEAPFFKFRGCTYVGGLSWRGPTADILSSCHSSGVARHFDPRQGSDPIWEHMPHMARLSALAWNRDGSLLVTCGAEDGIKCWDARMQLEIPLERERFSMEERWFVKNKTATMKGLAWCPWQAHLVATGGGTQDGLIRIYSIRTGTIISSVQTHCQVSSLHWSDHTTEILSTYGYSWIPGTRFRAPRPASILVHEMDKNTFALTPVAKALDTTHGRISYSCMNPDHTRLLTAGSDQTVKIWTVFGEPKNKSRKGSILREQENFR